MIRKPVHDSLKGTLQVPGDKSISHRAVMIGALSEGETHVTGFLPGADCLSTMHAFQSMGVTIEENGTEVLIRGAGLHGLRAPSGRIDCGNSGTTMRLMSGILAGQQFSSELTGDASLCRRPMRRVTLPLSEMGAEIRSLDGSGCAPLLVSPSRLRGIAYNSPVASAQVKSCILLAGMYAENETSVTEPFLSRDHTERMLSAFGADIRTEGTTASVQPEPRLTGCPVQVPGDISSAAYFIAAALMVPGSEICLTNVGTNPTRDGILDVVRMMGGSVGLENESLSGGEPTGDLIIRHQSLHGCTIGGALIPRLIDELPVIAVLAAYAEGTTVIRDAAELKVKESDRIALVSSMLSSMGADVTPTEDGMIIRGGRALHGAAIDSHLDHRMAMSAAIASLTAEGPTEITGAECVAVSYPSFWKDLDSLFS